MESKLEQLELFKQLRVENPNLPCKNCNGDCCGPDVYFNKDELKEIEKLVSIKKFKLEKALDGNSFKLSTKGVVNTKCVFLKNGKCSIYSVRPQICKDYGERIYIQCPYNGLKKIPEDMDERTRLTTKVQEVFFNKVNEIFGVKPNLVPHTAKNVIK